jgi:uncharacterized protein (DUF2252 family)
MGRWKLVPDGRESANLRRARNLKMAPSARAYVRGNTLKFYEWLDTTDNSKIAKGLPVWICGDCHVGSAIPTERSTSRSAS